jgi:hypothetical protein
LVLGFDINKPKDVVNTKGQKVNPTNILYDPKNNKTSVLGKATEESYENATDENGNIIYDPQYVEQVPLKVVKIKQIGDATVEDDVTVGNVLTQITNPSTGKKFKNIAEAKDYYKSIAPTSANSGVLD